LCRKNSLSPRGRYSYNKEKELITPFFLLKQNEKRTIAMETKSFLDTLLEVQGRFRPSWIKNITGL
jgi:hypothetical protein